MTVVSSLQYPDHSLWPLRRRRWDPLGFLESLARNGDFVPFLLARRQAFLLNRPDYVGAVLVSHAAKFEKGSANARAKHLLGTGLLTADSSLNAERRRVVQPAFARKRLEASVPAIVEHARRASSRWASGDIVEVNDWLARLTFEIVGKAIVGRDVAAFFDAVRAATDDATRSIDPLVSLVAPLRQLHRAQLQLRRAGEQILEGAAGEVDCGCLVTLLEAHGAGGDEQRLNDLLTILLAGHETITSALAWTWLLVGSHPNVERKMREELESTLGCREPSADDLPNLVYTRAVLAESLRLFPPAWVLAREAVEPHRFSHGEVPRGSLVLVSPYLLHRDARYFDRPCTFDPDRKPLSRLAYFPFGAGARACIGESFAMTEGVLLLATIAQRWKLTPIAPDFPPIDVRITMRPRGPVLMRIKKR